MSQPGSLGTLLSILIVNWNTRDKLLYVFGLNFRYPAFSAIETEVIVVDNHSHDEAKQRFMSSFPDVNLIQTGANTGYAAGSNIAFSQAKGELLLTLNPDTEMYEDTLDTAIRELQVHADCGVLSVKFRGPEGEVQSSVRGFPTLRISLGNPRYRKTKNGLGLGFLFSPRF
ncbi:MAG: glycosyltransferase [Fimbriimonadaceae bacterium]